MQDEGLGASPDLDDAGARELHPNQGRWISPDPAGLAAVNVTGPQTWNRYAYVSNNPLSYTDPLGLFDDATANGTSCASTPYCAPGTTICQGAGQLHGRYRSGVPPYRIH